MGADGRHTFPELLFHLRGNSGVGVREVEGKKKSENFSSWDI